MGQVLHGCATTTHAVRAAIQRSKASVPQIAERYGLNEKTVRKWRSRKTVEDTAMGPRNPRSTVLSPEQEAACVAFRRHTLLPLDDCLYALQDSIAELTRSSLHRLYQRHGISRLPDMKSEAEPKKAFKAYPIGYIHIDIAEVRTDEGKLHMFVAIDRTSKFVFVRLEEKATRATACQFLRDLIEAIPYKIHTVLTDNGVQFCHPPRYRDGPTATYMGHLFDRICAANGIEHRLTKPNHPWTNGQVERMNRTIMLATSSVVENRLISVVGRSACRKPCSASSCEMPFASACSAIRFPRISDRVGPGRTALTVTPVPTTASARPRETASCAVLVMP